MTGLEIYSRAVCFTALLLGCVALVSSIYSCIELGFTDFVYPENSDAKVKWERQRELRRIQIMSMGTAPDGGREYQLRVLEMEEFFDPQTYRKAAAKRNLVRTAIGILVCGLVFVIHWRIARRSSLQTQGT